MESLGDDILRLIFAGLPAEDLGRLRCTKKSWAEILSDDEFVAMQARRAVARPQGVLHVSAEPRGGAVMHLPVFADSSALPRLFAAHPGLSIAAAAHGLLLCHSAAAAPAEFFVCNPATAQIRPLPSPPYASALALAADSSGRYTAVTLLPSPTHFHFATLPRGAAAWCLHPDPLPCPDGQLCPSAAAVYARGAVHWLRTRGDIVAFDVDSCTAQLLSAPARSPIATQRVWFGAVAGKLSLAAVSEAQRRELRLWEMSDYAGRNWELKWRIQIDHYAHSVVPVFFNGEVAGLLKWTERSAGPEFWVADLKGMRWETRRFPWLSWLDMGRKYFPYISTLIQI